MATHDEFERLLDGVRDGSEAAASELFRRTQPRLLRYLRSQAPGPAEDIAAEVWVAVATGLDRVEGDEDGFRGWVFTIARRRLLDHHRRTQRQRTTPIEPHAFDDRVDGAAAAAVHSANDAQEAVDRIVAELSPEQAEVVVLRIVADLDADTVAAIMGRTAGWVRVTQYRALKRLARRLDVNLEATR